MSKKQKLEIKNDIQDTLASNIVLFNLNLKAANIKNIYAVRNSVNSLIDFVNSSELTNKKYIPF